MMCPSVHVPVELHGASLLLRYAALPKPACSNALVTTALHCVHCSSTAAAGTIAPLGIPLYLMC